MLWGRKFYGEQFNSYPPKIITLLRSGTSNTFYWEPECVIAVRYTRVHNDTPITRDGYSLHLMLQAQFLQTVVTEVFISIFRVEWKRLQVTRTMPDEDRYFLLQIQWQYILPTASTVVSLSDLCHNLESLSDEI